MSNGSDPAALTAASGVVVALRMYETHHPTPTLTSRERQRELLEQGA